MENLLSSNPVSRRTDPVSSSLAEIEVSRRARGEQQRAVLFAVIENPGCTSMELSVVCGLERYPGRGDAGRRPVRDSGHI